MKGDQIKSCQSLHPWHAWIQMALEPTGQPDIWDLRVAPVSETCTAVGDKKGNKTKCSLLARFVARGAADHSEVHLKCLNVQSFKLSHVSPTSEHLAWKWASHQARPNLRPSSLMKSLNDMKAKHHKKWCVCGCVCFAHWELEDEEFGWWQGCSTRAAFCLHFRTLDIARPWPTYHPCDIECSSAVVATSQSFAFDMRLWDSLGSVTSHRRGQRRRSSTQKSPQGFKLMLDTNTFRCDAFGYGFFLFLLGGSLTNKEDIAGRFEVSILLHLCVLMCLLLRINWAEMPPIDPGKITSFYVLCFWRYSIFINIYYRLDFGHAGILFAQVCFLHLILMWNDMYDHIISNPFLIVPKLATLVASSIDLVFRRL